MPVATIVILLVLASLILLCRVRSRRLSAPRRRHEQDAFSDYFPMSYDDASNSGGNSEGFGEIGANIDSAGSDSSAGSTGGEAGDVGNSGASSYS